MTTPELSPETIGYFMSIVSQNPGYWAVTVRGHPSARDTYTLSLIEAGLLSATDKQISIGVTVKALAVTDAGKAFYKMMKI